jgi:hypothetical protein
MTQRNPRFVWISRIIAISVIVGLAIYLIFVGLNAADKLGSAIGAVVALVALLAPYVLPPRGAGAAISPAQHVSDAVIGGRLTQIGSVKGKLQIGPRRTGQTASQVASASLPSAATTQTPTSDGQHITNVRVGDDVTQAGRVDGDVTLS